MKYTNSGLGAFLDISGSQEGNFLQLVDVNDSEDLFQVLLDYEISIGNHMIPSAIWNK